MQPLSPFRLAFPVNDLEEARSFYGGLLGCPEGRGSGDWVDFIEPHVRFKGQTRSSSRPSAT